MSDLSKFRELSARERVVVACAVLLDGVDAPAILMNDKNRGAALMKAAQDCLELPIELRLPLIGTLTRVSLDEIRAA